MVTILAGHEITVDTHSAVANKVTVEGTLKASRSVSSTLTVSGNLIVQGSGVLDYGTPLSRIPVAVVARIRFSLNEANYVGGSTTEPLDSDVGLWVVDSGKLYTAGHVRDGWTLMTSSAPVGAASISVDSRFASGWRVGDVLVIGPSHVGGSAAAHTDEVRMITAIPSLGTFTLNAPLVNNHVVQTVSWTDAWGKSWTERLAPPVANLTRNIVFDAVNPAHRPHMAAMDAAVVQMEDAVFVNFSPVPKNLGTFPNGRPKPMSRYAIHFHGQTTGSQFSYVKRTVVAGGMGDGIHIHDSYGVVMEDVVVYDQAKSSSAATYPIYLEGRVATDGTLVTDTGANHAWIERPLTLRWGSSQNIRSAGVWAEAGVAAYVVGLHCASAQGRATSCMHWHNTFSGDENSQSQWPVVGERQPRLLRGTAHALPVGFSTWQNPGPAQDIVDLLAWNNAIGLNVGAYHTDRRFFEVRSIGNAQSQFKHSTMDLDVTGFLADGLNRGGVGITVGDQSLVSNADAVYEMGVVRGASIAVTFADCLQNVSNPCNSARSFVQFSRINFEGNPQVKFVWHPNSATRLRIRNQSGLARPVHFNLHRKDQVGVGGVFDAEYDGIRVNNDAAGALSRPPMVNMVSGSSFPGCASDDAVVNGLVTLCAETDAPTVEFWVGGKRIATVSAAGLLAQTIFSISTWPHGGAYVYAKAIGSDGRVSHSRVFRLRKPSGINSAASQP